MATNDIPLPSGSTFMTMSEERQKKIDGLLQNLGTSLSKASMEHGIHKVVIAHVVIVALQFTVAQSGHSDIAEAIGRMLNGTLAWPNDNRGKELAGEQAVIISDVVGETLLMIGFESESEKEALFFTLNVLANVTVILVEDVWGKDVAEYVREKLLLTSDWSLAKGVGEANGSVN